MCLNAGKDCAAALISSSSKESNSSPFLGTYVPILTANAAWAKMIVFILPFKLLMEHAAPIGRVLRPYFTLPKFAITFVTPLNPV